MDLVFATANPHKVAEINAILGGAFLIKGLRDIGCHEELPETQDSIPGNAEQKARYVHEHYGVDCFSEDTGLEVDALGGAPGVHTAHYAGPERSAEANMARLLHELGDNPQRGAQFRTVIALILGGNLHLFEGICRGRIAYGKSGGQGFGYDPIFVPDGYEQSFAELGSDIKNRISHRAKATAALKAFLETT